MTSSKQTDQEVLVKTYRNRKRYEKDAQKLGKAGWIPVSTTESGTLHGVYTVTYQRSVTAKSRPSLTDSWLDWFRWWRQRGSA